MKKEVGHLADELFPQVRNKPCGRRRQKKQAESWQWRMQGRRMEDGRWKMEDGGWKVEDEGWAMEDGRRKMEDGGWKMAERRWWMEDREDGRRKMEVGTWMVEDGGVGDGGWRMEDEA